MGDNIKSGSGIELDLLELPDMPELNDEDALGRNLALTSDESAKSDLNGGEKVVLQQKGDVGISAIQKGWEQDLYGKIALSDILAELDKKMKSGQFLHTFTAQIEEINRIIKMKYSSSRDIASVILKDVALASRVLSIVNSCYYGQFTHKGIASISDAMVILGTEEVQQAAATLLLFEFMRDISKSEMLKEKSLASLMRGMMAKEIAHNSRYKSPDEFQITAMLYDIGEQIILFCKPEIYQRIGRISKDKGIGRDGVAQKMIGASFSQIGQEIISGWGFPKSVVESIRPFEEFGSDPKQMSFQTLKRLVASFTNEMCNIDWRTSEIFRNQKIEEIVMRYGHLLDLGLSGADELLNSSIKKVENHARILDVKLNNSRFDRRRADGEAETRIRKLPAQQAGGAEAEIKAFAEQILSGESSQIVSDTKAESLGDDLDDKVIWVESQIHKIETAMDSGFKLSEILQLVITTIYKGFFFSRISICIMNRENGMMAARLVLGDDSERFAREFRFVVSDSDDLFNKALSTGIDIVVEELRGRGLNSRIPEWYVKGGFAGSFAIYPVVVERKKVGMIYVDWETSQTHLFSDQIKQFMKRLKNLTITAIKKSRT